MDSPEDATKKSTRRRIKEALRELIRQEDWFLESDEVLKVEDPEAYYQEVIEPIEGKYAINEYACYLLGWLAHQISEDSLLEMATTTE